MFNCLHFHCNFTNEPSFFLFILDDSTLLDLDGFFARVTFNLNVFDHVSALQSLKKDVYHLT